VQRLHEDDLPGNLLRAGGSQDLSFPVVAVERARILIGEEVGGILVDFRE
jgi:hypothetical protein